MSKLQLNKPTLILLYGYPGSGKTYFARNFCDEVAAAHVHDDRMRNEIFQKPRFDREENEVLQHLMGYMAEEFLKAGMSVVFDANAMRASQRRLMRDMARRLKAEPVLIWFQIDPETAFQRASKRDRRKADDKYAFPVDQQVFASIASFMQNPTQTEDYMVLSGKHTYSTQSRMAMKKLYDMGLIEPKNIASKIARPGLVNYVPNPLAGRFDNSRRNIKIR